MYLRKSRSAKNHILQKTRLTKVYVKMLPSNSIRPSPTVYRQYFRRLIRPKQMDFEFAFWLMVQLCFAPKKTYLHISYHKETKNQWSRDDPAYVVLLGGLLFLSASVHCLTFGDGLAKSVGIVFYVVLVDFVLCSVLIATCFWSFANRVLRRKNAPFVEWLYAFDVQCNSYFVLFVFLHLFQFAFSPLLRSTHFIACCLSNALYVFAFSFYHYLNFLGYSSLPFLAQTELFLYPIGVLILVLPISIVTRFNPTKFVFSLYFGS